ncbi:MAG TPA: hypothetical protein VMV49_04775 [Candidatus Deferrimicrobium sp.]|nr:hypothetical protein [Candidatus Deferrimicrobium sp.]
MEYAPIQLLICILILFLNNEVTSLSGYRCALQFSNKHFHGLFRGVDRERHHIAVVLNLIVRTWLPDQPKDKCDWKVG